MLDALIFGYDQNDAALMDQPANQSVYGVFEHLDDGGFWAPFAILSRDPSNDSIAMHGLEHFARGDEHVVTTCIRPDEAKTIAMTHQFAGELQVFSCLGRWRSRLIGV